MRSKVVSAGLFLMAVTAGVGALQAQSAIDLNTPLTVDPLVRVSTLENGLRYYVRANSEPENRAELLLVVNAGSVLEDDDQLGLAHFIEHMAFNGTEGFPRQDLIDYLERIGMSFGPEINASTSFDETIYALTVPTDSAEILETAFQILEEWAHKLVFDPEMVDGERGVVVEEWRSGRGAAARMFDQQFPILFKDSRYAERLPIGTVESIETFDHEVLWRFYNDWYRPDLMAVVAVGDFDSDVVESLIRDRFSRIQARENPRPREIFAVPDHDETLVAIATDPEATESGVSLYYKQPLRTTSTTGDYRRLIVERLYNRLLNNRLSEQTFQPDPPFLYASSGQGRLIRSKEVYTLGAAVADGEIERGLEAILTEVERVARFGFTPTELEREKTELLQIMEHAYAEREKSHSATYARAYTSAFLTNEPTLGILREYELYSEFLQGILLEEVNRFAREWLTNRNRVVLVTAPEKEGVEIPAESNLLAMFDHVKASEIGEYDDAVDDGPLVAEVPPPGEVVEEEHIEEIGVTRWLLSNGARVILKPTDFKDDEILFRASSPGGTSLAPDENYIAASTAGSVVGVGGLGTFGLIELQKKLAGTTANVTASIGPYYESLGGGATPEDVKTLFELIYLKFTAPRLDSNAYEGFRSQLESLLENRSVDPVEVFHDTLNVTLAQHHFRARPPTIDVYSEMDLAKSYEFYLDRFTDAGDFTFVFVGNFELETLRPLVEAYIATLPHNGRVETWRDVGLRPPTGVVERSVSRGMEPRSQTTIVFTGPFEYTQENRHLFWSLAELLQIKLRERLREDLGGTYTVNVSGATERDPISSYSIQVSFSADPGRLEELVAAVFDEINTLQDSGPNSDDVDKVREAQRRTRETSLRQNAYWMYQLLYADRFGTDPLDLIRYDRYIDGLTSDMIRGAADRYLDVSNYVRVSLYPEGM